MLFRCGKGRQELLGDKLRLCFHKTQSKETVDLFLAFFVTILGFMIIDR